MPVATRLLTGGTGVFRIPRVFEMTTAPEGAWPSLGGSPFYDSNTGKTVFGFANAAGDINAGTFDHSTGAVSVTTIGGPTSPDQHNLPSIIRRASDGRYVTMFSSHASPNIYRRISTNPGDISTWGTADNMDSSIGGTAYTYSALMQFLDATGDPIYNFVRDQDGAGNNWILTKSTDGGSTFGTLTNLVFGTRYYARAFKSSESRMDFVVCNGSYAEDFASLRHGYFDVAAGTYHQTDGTAIGGSPPFDFTDFTLVYDGATAGVRAPADLCMIGNDIVTVFPVQTGTPSGHLGEDEDYILCRSNNGGAWSNRYVAQDIGALTFEFPEGSMAIDRRNLNHLIVSRRAVSSLASPFRLYDYWTTDEGVTWTYTQRATLSSAAVMLPWSVENYEPELTDLSLFGIFTSQSDFSSGIQGFGVAV